MLLYTVADWHLQAGRLPLLRIHVSVSVRGAGMSPMVTVQSLAAALQNYTIYYEVVPFCGEIDHERCRITINPVFAADAEILLHELLHVFYPNAPEEWIKKAAQDIIKIRLDVKNYLNDYCYRHARHSGSSLLAMMG